LLKLETFSISRLDLISNLALGLKSGLLLF
jgi:hypothetical protein